MDTDRASCDRIKREAALGTVYFTNAKTAAATSALNQGCGRFSQARRREETTRKIKTSNGSRTEEYLASMARPDAAPAPYQVQLRSVYKARPVKYRDSIQKKAWDVS